MKFNIKKFFGICLFFTCVFPYISIIKTPFDTQPYALLFSFVLLLFLIVIKRDLKIPKMLIPFFFIICYALIVALMFSDFNNALRPMIGYISVFVIALASFYTFDYIKGTYFIFSVMMWFVFGVIQLLFDKNFGSFFLSRLSTSEGRGVTSLAVEPSMYAFTCIFFLMLNDIFYAKQEYSKKAYQLLFALILIQILFAKSAVGMIALVVYFFAKFVSSGTIQRALKSLIGLLSVILIILFVFSTVPRLQQSRMGTLLQAIEYNPMSVIYTDESVADRLGHVLVSHLSLFYNHGIGYGLGTWNENANTVISNSNQFVKNVTMVAFSLDRIMSGWGSVIFELGIMGVVFMVAFIVIMIKGKRKVNYKLKIIYISSLITIYFVMLMAVPISYPLFGYLIGVFVNLQYEKKYYKNIKKQFKVKIKEIS